MGIEFQLSLHLYENQVKEVCQLFIADFFLFWYERQTPSFQSFLKKCLVWIIPVISIEQWKTSLMIVTQLKYKTYFLVDNVDMYLGIY